MSPLRVGVGRVLIVSSPPAELPRTRMKKEGSPYPREQRAFPKRKPTTVAGRVSVPSSRSQSEEPHPWDGPATVCCAAARPARPDVPGKGAQACASASCTDPPHPASGPAVLWKDNHALARAAGVRPETCSENPMPQRSAVASRLRARSGGRQGAEHPWSRPTALLQKRGIGRSAAAAHSRAVPFTNLVGGHPSFPGGRRLPQPLSCLTRPG
jgi:hypothetical protein